MNYQQMWDAFWADIIAFNLKKGMTLKQISVELGMSIKDVRRLKNYTEHSQ